MKAYGFRLLLVFGMVASLPIPPSSASIQFGSTVTIEGLEEQQKRWATKCRLVWSKRNRVDGIFTDPELNRAELAELAVRLVSGKYGCRKQSPALALDIMERLVSRSSAFATDFSNLDRLIWLHNEVKRPGFAQQVLELERIRWLRGRYYGEVRQPFSNDAEQRAFVSRDDVWTYLLSVDKSRYGPNRHLAQAYLDPQSDRFDAATGIELAENWGHPGYKVQAAEMLLDDQEVAIDFDRAEALLWDAARSSEEARMMLLPLVTLRLNSSDVAVRDATADTLYELTQKRTLSASATSIASLRDQLSPYYGERISHQDIDVSSEAVRRLARLAVKGSEPAAKLLLHWINQRLAGQDDALKPQAWTILAGLVQSDVPGAKDVLDLDVARSGGVIDVSLGDSHRLRNRTFIWARDYPSRALREGREGVVIVELLVSPSGRGIDASVVKSAHPDLDRLVSKVALRRARFKVNEHRGRYFRVTMPSVQFRFFGCEEDRVPATEIPSAIVIDGQCRRNEIQI